MYTYVRGGDDRPFDFGMLFKVSFESMVALVFYISLGRIYDQASGLPIDKLQAHFFLYNPCCIAL